MGKPKKREPRLTMPIRFNALRNDASIQSALKMIETKLKLPRGSVKFVYPSGRRARSDSTVGALLEHWDKRG